MTHVMTTAQRSKGTYVIHIHLTAMTSHRFSHREEIGTSRSDKIVPEPHRRREFGIVPGIAAHVIPPGVTF